MEYPKLSLPAINLRARRSEGQTMVWSEVRSCYLLLTPEEWVRRHFVAFLISSLKVAVAQIVEEYIVDINGQSQRADIVVIDRMGRAEIVVECKAPTLRMTQQVVDQAMRYNSVLGAHYIVITNGLTHFCYDTQMSAAVADITSIVND